MYQHTFELFLTSQTVLKQLRPIRRGERSQMLLYRDRWFLAIYYSQAPALLNMPHLWCLYFAIPSASSASLGLLSGPLMMVKGFCKLDLIVLMKEGNPLIIPVRRKRFPSMSKFFCPLMLSPGSTSSKTQALVWSREIITELS